MTALTLPLAGGCGLRTQVSLTHASVLMVLSLGLAANAIAGAFYGVGGYPFLLTNHIAAVGLLQAYLLMTLIGTTIWVAARTTNTFPRAWHYVLIVAHLVPLLAVALFTASTPQMTLDVVALSLIIHGTGIAAELFALTRRDTQ